MSNDTLLCAAVRFSVFKDGMRKRVFKGLAAVAASSPVFAMAADDLASMSDSAAEGAKTFQKNILVIAQMFGVVFVIGGLIAAKNKKDNPQIKTGAIVASVIFGAVLVVVPEIIKRSQAQIGLSPVDVG
jgi:cytochrome bd-type quinol oxidase subunit 2